MEVRRRQFDPSNLPLAVSQCPFDPYRAGAKVYRAYWAGGRPAPQTTLPRGSVTLVTWFFFYLAYASHLLRHRTLPTDRLFLRAAILLYPDA
jgi:hypothetical protein